MQPKITDEQLKEEMAAGLTNQAIADKYNMAKRNVSIRKARLVSKGWSPEHDMTKESPEGFTVKGTSTLYDGAGNITAQWVKTQQDKEEQLKLIKDTLHMWVDELPQVKKTVKSKHKYEDMLAVYPLGDPHIGMFSWKKETGEVWDLAEAERVFAGVFDRVIKSAPPCNEAVILNLGDFFHYDNMEGTTTRSGHALDRDGQYAAMVQIGIQIIRRMITTALGHHKRVRVINVIGNHDDVSSIFLGACLKHVYEKEPRVTIDDNPTPFHYIKFGKVLLGAHHGHSCKADKLPGVMATDKAKAWGDTEHRYWLTGHIHHDSMKEYAGCKVESFRTLAAKDAYATWGGWRSGRDTKAIVYHKDHGEVERHTINISQLD
tara:strand:+ start:13509 stop:14633 length:1125 start_codon:yes stop_codon:yes gene_type:complete